MLYITDSLESEDAFYMYENGQLVKQKGYFVYYTKNEPMQNYIIKQRGGNSNEKDTEIHRKDAELIKNYRQKNANNAKIKDSKETSGISLLYVASSFVVLAMLAMGITVISSYDKMKDMEVSINRLEITATEERADGPEATEVMADGTATLIDAGDEISSTDTTSETENVLTEEQVYDDITENTTEIVAEVAETSEEDISTEQTLPAMNDNSPEYYTVEYGDTLSSIAYERYGSIEYAINIAEANGIDYEAKIYEGQRILLPNIQ